MPELRLSKKIIMLSANSETQDGEIKLFTPPIVPLSKVHLEILEICENKRIPLKYSLAALYDITYDCNDDLRHLDDNACQDFLKIIKNIVPKRNIKTQANYGTPWLGFDHDWQLVIMKNNITKKGCQRTLFLQHKSFGDMIVVGTLFNERNHSITTYLKHLTETVKKLDQHFKLSITPENYQPLPTPRPLIVSTGTPQTEATSTKDPLFLIEAVIAKYQDMKWSISFGKIKEIFDALYLAATADHDCHYECLIEYFAFCLNSPRHHCTFSKKSHEYILTLFVDKKNSTEEYIFPTNERSEAFIRQLGDDLKPYFESDPNKYNFLKYQMLVLFPQKLIVQLKKELSNIGKLPSLGDKILESILLEEEAVEVLDRLIIELLHLEPVYGYPIIDRLIANFDTLKITEDTKDRLTQYIEEHFSKINDTQLRLWSDFLFKTNPTRFCTFLQNKIILGLWKDIENPMFRHKVKMLQEHMRKQNVIPKEKLAQIFHPLQAFYEKQAPSQKCLPPPQSHTEKTKIKKPEKESKTDRSKDLFENIRKLKKAYLDWINENKLETLTSMEFFFKNDTRLQLVHKIIKQLDEQTRKKILNEDDIPKLFEDPLGPNLPLCNLYQKEVYQMQLKFSRTLTPPESTTAEVNLFTLLCWAEGHEKSLNFLYGNVQRWLPGTAIHAISIVAVIRGYDQLLSKLKAHPNFVKIGLDNLYLETLAKRTTEINHKIFNLIAEGSCELFRQPHSDFYSENFDPANLGWVLRALDGKAPELLLWMGQLGFNYNGILKLQYLEESLLRYLYEAAIITSFSLNTADTKEVKARFKTKHEKESHFKERETTSQHFKEAVRIIKLFGGVYLDKILLGKTLGEQEETIKKMVNANRQFYTALRVLLQDFSPYHDQETPAIHSPTQKNIKKWAHYLNDPFLYVDDQVYEKPISQLHLLCYIPAMYPLVDHLLQNNADPNILAASPSQIQIPYQGDHILLPTFNDPALCIATLRGNLNAVFMLLMNGCDINIPGEYGRTALHQAALRGDCTILLLLLKFSPLINKPDIFGNTPLHYAAQNGMRLPIMTLLKVGADPRVKNNENKYPLQMLREKDTKEQQKILLKATFPGTRPEERDTISEYIAVPPDDLHPILEALHEIVFDPRWQTDDPYRFKTVFSIIRDRYSIPMEIVFLRAFLYQFEQHPGESYYLMVNFCRENKHLIRNFKPHISRLYEMIVNVDPITPSDFFAAARRPALTN